MIKEEYKRSSEGETLPPAIREKIPALENVRREAEERNADQSTVYEIDERGEFAIVKVNGIATTRLRLSPASMFVRRAVG